MMLFGIMEELSNELFNMQISLTEIQTGLGDNVNWVRVCWTQKQMFVVFVYFMASIWVLVLNLSEEIIPIQDQGQFAKNRQKESLEILDINKRTQINDNKWILRQTNWHHNKISRGIFTTCYVYTSFFFEKS